MINMNDHASVKTLELKLKLYIRDGRIDEAIGLIKILDRPFTRTEMEKMISSCKDNGRLSLFFLMVRRFEHREPTRDEVEEIVRHQYLYGDTDRQFRKMIRQRIEIRRDHFGAICSVLSNELFTSVAWSHNFKNLVCFPPGTPKQSLKYGHPFDGLDLWNCPRDGFSSRVISFD